MPQNEPIKAIEINGHSTPANFFLSYCFLCCSFSSCSVCLCMPIHVSLVSTLRLLVWVTNGIFFVVTFSHNDEKVHENDEMSCEPVGESIAIKKIVKSRNVGELQRLAPENYCNWTEYMCWLALIIIYLLPWQQQKLLICTQMHCDSEPEKSKFVAWYFVLSGRSLIPFHTMAQCHW